MEDSDNKRCRSSGVTIDGVIEQVIPYITDPKDRDYASLVCRRWCKVDAETREHVTLSLCYTAKSDCLSRRFSNLRLMKLKGKPRAAMFNLIPENWGGYVTPWVNEIAASFRQLKSVHFRRMIVSDLDLDLLAKARKDELEVLKLHKCSGFSTDWLLSLARHCRRELERGQSIHAVECLMHNTRGFSDQSVSVSSRQTLEGIVKNR
ncbi:PREDICTED: coronatine-insensitive protein 1-like isoform X2 [Tarenaya hassleriana]|uniref:coronatine-insensitive protein 1-like isoform X2 n=1 Tax=Tarenaya hassleriana TaxID=28532 RepID=UPI00053C90E0|nr:PREDICTED: coronatine-insensitive protein 1-like isoform X2 [Tarenaya hassleriana]